MAKNDNDTISPLSAAISPTHDEESSFVNKKSDDSVGDLRIKDKFATRQTDFSQYPSSNTNINIKINEMKKEYPSSATTAYWWFKT